MSARRQQRLGVLGGAEMKLSVAAKSVSIAHSAGGEIDNPVEQIRASKRGHICIYDSDLSA